jgi:hypothetical protein
MYFKYLNCLFIVFFNRLQFHPLIFNNFLVIIVILFQIKPKLNPKQLLKYFVDFLSMSLLVQHFILLIFIMIVDINTIMLLLHIFYYLLTILFIHFKLRNLKLKEFPLHFLPLLNFLKD